MTGGRSSYTTGAPRGSHRLLVAALIAATCAFGSAASDVAVTRAAAPSGAGWCQQARITGYVRTEYSSATFDGTPIWTDEAIAAASWNIPLGSSVDVEGLGTYRIADRGLLGSSGWIDIAVWTRSEAFAITSVRTVCVTPPS